MGESGETAALKAAVRGALDAGESLRALRDRIESIEADADAGLVDDLARVSAAHAIASAALRGFVNRMLERREKT
jgi:hypothetical protein